MAVTVLLLLPEYDGSESKSFAESVGMWALSTSIFGLNSSVDSNETGEGSGVPE